MRGRPEHHQGFLSVPLGSLRLVFGGLCVPEDRMGPLSPPGKGR